MDYSYSQYPGFTLVLGVPENNFLFTQSSIGLEEISLLLCSSLVPVKPKRLTNTEQQSFSLPEQLKEIAIGLRLGALNIQKQKVNAQLRFEQGTVHTDYLFHLYLPLGSESYLKVIAQQLLKFLVDYPTKEQE